MQWKETEDELSVMWSLFVFVGMLTGELVLIELKEERDITNTGTLKPVCFI